MRPRDLGAARSQHRLQRFLDSLLGMEADNIVVLIRVPGERTSR